jgi:hypothetical protein
MKKASELKAESVKLKDEIINKISLKLVIYGAITLMFVILSSLVVYLYFQYTDTKALLKSKISSEKQAANELVTRVSKLIELPKEAATIATVSDKKKLASQPFFDKAENGDKVLIYSEAKKAILYRPSTNKIIEVGPISVPSAPPISPQAQTVKVALFNGSGTVGLAGQTEKTLLDALKNIEVVEKADARESYDKTVVYDISKSHSAQALEIATLLGGVVTGAPEGEAVPEADILVIIGK